MNALADAKSLQTSISSTLLELLNHGRPVVRKRSINALSAFSTIAPDNVFNLVAQELITQLSAKSKQNDYAKLQTIISALASLWYVILTLAVPMQTEWRDLLVC